MLLNKVGVGWAEEGKGGKLGKCNRITVKNYSMEKVHTLPDITTCTFAFFHLLWI